MLVQKYYFIFYVFIWQILFIDFFHIYNSTKKMGTHSVFFDRLLVKKMQKNNLKVLC